MQVRIDRAVSRRTSVVFVSSTTNIAFGREAETAAFSLIRYSRPDNRNVELIWKDLSFVQSRLSWNAFNFVTDNDVPNDFGPIQPVH